MSCYTSSLFTSLILSRITYALSVCGGHLTNEQRQRINAFLKQAQKSRFTEALYSTKNLLENADARLCGRLQKPAIAFILFCLVTINLNSSSREKEGIYLLFRTVLITLKNLSPLSF